MTYVKKSKSDASHNRADCGRKCGCYICNSHDTPEKAKAEKNLPAFSTNARNLNSTATA